MTRQHIPCFFINLDHASQRQAHMEQQFAALGISATRISAVDGTALSDAACRKHNPREEGAWELSRPEIGCFLSHLQIWDMVAQGNDAYVAVFEDDVFLSDDTADFIKDGSWIPNGTGFIKIDAFPNAVLLAARRTLGRTSRQLANVESYVLCTGGYIISRDCAALLTQSMRPIVAPVDEQLFDRQYGAFGNRRIHQLYPALCIQAHMYARDFSFETSTISEHRSASPVRPKRHRKLGPIKLIQEIVRPFRRYAKRHVIPKLRALRVRGKWTTIPFQH